jgi:hypothetical protein
LPTWEISLLEVRIFYFRKFTVLLGSFEENDMVVKEGWFDVDGDGPDHVTSS